MGTNIGPWKAMEHWAPIKVSGGGARGMPMPFAHKDRAIVGSHGVDWSGNPTNWDDVVEAVNRIPKKVYGSSS